MYLLSAPYTLFSEAFTIFYTGGHHLAAGEYLFFGAHGKHALVPWIWSALGLEVLAIGLLLGHARTGRPALLNVACGAAFAGVWIEKGMGLIVPGFVPSTLHEVIEYVPTLVEWKITVGIWAFGAMVLTVAIKLVVSVLTDPDAPASRR